MVPGIKVELGTILRSICLSQDLGFLRHIVESSSQPTMDGGWEWAESKKAISRVCPRAQQQHRNDIMEKRLGP